MAGDYWIQVDGEVVGPIDASGFRDLLEQRFVHHGTLTRKGDGDWKPAHVFDGLVSDPVASPTPAPPKPREAVAKIDDDGFLQFTPTSPESKSEIITSPEDSGRVFLWSLPFGLTPVKVLSTVLTFLGGFAFVITIPVFLIGCYFISRVEPNPAWLAVTMTILSPSVTLFLTGIVFLTGAELLTRFCLIEEHLRHLRGKSDA